MTATSISDLSAASAGMAAAALYASVRGVNWRLRSAAGTRRAVRALREGIGRADAGADPGGYSGLLRHHSAAIAVVMPW